MEWCDENNQHFVQFTADSDNSRVSSDHFVTSKATIISLLHSIYLPKDLNKHRNSYKTLIRLLPVCRVFGGLQDSVICDTDMAFTRHVSQPMRKKSLFRKV